MEFIGKSDAKIILYLQHKNLTIDDYQLNRCLGESELNTIISNSTNDWRKVCTVFSKIVVGILDLDINWKKYLENHLFQGSGFEKVVWAKSKPLKNEKSIHIIAGKSNFETMVVDHTSFESTGETNKIMNYKNYFKTPYLDYRQFSNNLIDEFVNYAKQCL